MKTTYMIRVILTVAVVITAACLAQDAGRSSASQSQPQSTPQCHQHSMDMQGRGDEGMGFSQAKTTHHFILAKDGGAISVEANDARDTASRDQIRMHLAHIAQAFAAGEFDIPMFVHNQVPAGVPVMKAQKGQIRYRFEETAQGGRVVIATSNPEALSAVHEFLSFQIREHKTGDSLTMQDR